MTTMTTTQAKTSPLRSLIVPVAAALMAALATVACPAPAMAQIQEASPEQRAEFNKLLRQRSELNARLHHLDQRAARMLKQGKKPTVIHAEQTGVQDQLDRTELRLEILATRYGLAVPPLPEYDGDGADSGDGRRSSDPKIDQAFARGRNRALGEVRRDVDEFLASLDFRAFLDR